MKIILYLKFIKIIKYNIENMDFIQNLFIYTIIFQKLIYNF